MKTNEELKVIIRSTFDLYRDIANARSYVPFWSKFKVKRVLYLRLCELLGDLKKEEKVVEKATKNSDNKANTNNKQLARQVVAEKVNDCLKPLLDSSKEMVTDVFSTESVSCANERESNTTLIS